MRWSSSFLLVGVANALLPGWHLLDNLDELTTTTKLLLSPAGEINLVNAPQVIIRRGPLYHVLDGMRDFFREGSTLANQFTGEEVYHDEETEEVLHALEGLLDVNKMLVDVFHNKAHLLSKIPALGSPIASGLRGIDTVIKVLTSDVSSALPAEYARRIERAETVLSCSLAEAIEVYSTFEKMASVTDANGSGSWLA